MLCIVQARVSSTRLPGKVLKPLLGEPMIIRQVERINKCQSINSLVVATSEDDSDLPLVELLIKNNIEVFRGNLNDVLDRFYQAAVKYNAKYIVRITGDCPVIDPSIIDEVIKTHIENQNDYTSNAIEPTYPDGLDVEVINFNILEKVARIAKLPSEREHVTQYIVTRKDNYKIGQVRNDVDYSNMRWTVDEPEDYEFIKCVYHELYQNNKNFNMDDIVSFVLNNPDKAQINSTFKRNEGLQKSIENDKDFLSNE